MSKWHGKIGYIEYIEVEPGVYSDKITEKFYYGDVTVDRFKRQTSNEVNENINIANVFSIVADPFVFMNCSLMAYIEYMGVKWKITDIEIQSPRIFVTVGGIWNENQIRTP